MSKEIWIFVGLGLIALVALLTVIANLIRKAGPHEALIVYGWRGTRIVKGQGTLILPMFESFRQLGGVLAAGLGHGGLAAAATADHFRDLADQLAGV